MEGIGKGLGTAIVVLCVICVDNVVDTVYVYRKP